MKQSLPALYRESFIDVERLVVLRGQRKVIDWLKDNQVDEGGVKSH